MPTLLADDPLNCASSLAACWNWVIHASQVKLSHIAKDGPGIQTTKESETTVVLRLVLPSENVVCSATLDGSKLLEFFSFKNNPSGCDWDKTECQKCIVLGLIYGCIVYKQISGTVDSDIPLDHHSTPNLFDDQVVIPSHVTLSLPNTSPSSSSTESLLQLLELVWTNVEEIHSLSHDVLSLVCFLSIRFGHLNIISRHQFLRSILPWTFYRCVADNKLFNSPLNDQQIRIDDPSSFGIALIHLILHLPTSTFTNDNEVTLVNNVCEFILGSMPDNQSPVIQWLATQCLSSVSTHSDLYNYIRVHILLSVLLFWRALSWIRVDGISLDMLASMNGQLCEGLSRVAVAARQRAICVVIQMWNFKQNSKQTDQTSISDLPESSDPNGTLTSSECFPFRRSICLLMGRQLLFLLSDAGRISEMSDVLQWLATPCPSSWLNLFESAERGQDFTDTTFAPAQPAGTEANDATVKDSDSSKLQDLILFKMLKSRFALAEVNQHYDSGKIKELNIQKSIGLTFGAPVPSTPNLQRPLQPPQIQSLLTKKNGKEEPPIIFLFLMMIPASLELQCMMVELSILHHITYLSEKSDSRTLRHHLHWLIYTGIYQRPLDRLILRLPVLFPLLSEICIERKTREKHQPQTRASAVQQLPNETSVDLNTALLWDNELFEEDPENPFTLFTNSTHSTITPIVPSPTTVGKSDVCLCGIGESELCRQLFLALEVSSSVLSPTAVSRSRCSLVETSLFTNFSNAFRIHLHLVSNRIIIDQDFTNCLSMNDITPSYVETNPIMSDTTSTSGNMDDSTSSSLLPSGKIPLHDAIPSWWLCHALQKNCLSCQTHAPPSDMICSWLFHFLTPFNHSTPGPLQLRTYASRQSIHPCVASLLHFISLILKRWSVQLGTILQTSLTLLFFEYSIQQLRSSNKLPTFDQSTLSCLMTPTQSCKVQIQQTLSSYYSTLCNETLVGRLLVLSGIEPQFLIPPVHHSIPSRGCLWLPSPEARRSLRFPLCGLSILEELSLNESPFSHAEFPVNKSLLRALSDAFLLLIFRVPFLWPSERLLAAVTIELNSSSLN